MIPSTSSRASHCLIPVLWDTLYIENIILVFQSLGKIFLSVPTLLPFLFLLPILRIFVPSLGFYPAWQLFSSSIFSRHYYPLLLDPLLSTLIFVLPIFFLFSSLRLPSSLFYNLFLFFIIHSSLIKPLD